MAERKFAVELTSLFTDDKTRYSQSILMTSNDLFKSQAAFNLAKDLWERQNMKQELIRIDADRLKVIADNHHHPNSPCSWEQQKGKFTCGAKE